MRKMVTEISQDLDDLGFIEGKDFIAGGRNSGRTIRMLKAALHQLDFMEPGEEIWVVTDRIERAKRLAEQVGNHLADEMGFEQEGLLGPNHDRKIRASMRKGTQDCRYFLTFKDDKHIHFCSVDTLHHQLLGKRLTHNPSIFFEHICYEFGAIQNASYDLYALLQGMV